MLSAKTLPLGSESEANSFMRKVKMRQMTGVMIWQQLVQGCLACSCALLKNRALNWVSFLGFPF